MNRKALPTKYAAVLSAVKGLGPKRIATLRENLQEKQVDISELWTSNRFMDWKAVGITPHQFAQIQRFQKRFTPEDYLGWLNAQQIQVLGTDDIYYPKLLKEIDSKPQVIYAKGSLEVLNQPPIAVVGTRHVSGYGRSVCQQIVGDLVALGAMIVSGFMYGVDTCAHKSALGNNGQTVGVLGFGFDYLTPRSNRSLFREMLRRGQVFITEYPPWVRPARWTFPARNRIVAGMSMGVVVVEAAQKSGSRITAQYGVDYDRGVFAIPGPMKSIYSQGTKLLINDGAKLVTSGREIFEEIRGLRMHWQEVTDTLTMNKTKKQEKNEQLVSSNPNEQKIYDLLQKEPLFFAQIEERLGFSSSELMQNLSTLELAGRITLESGAWRVS